MIWYVGLKPHADKHRYYLELYNEVMIMIINYHMIIFTDYTLND